MNKKKILIVEDDPKQARILSDLLDERGFLVDVASDGKTGIDMVGKDDYSVVLLDLILPEMGGAEFLKKLSEDSVRKNTPVIVITNSTSKEHMASVLEYGVLNYFVKAETKLEDIMFAVEQAAK